MLVSLLFLRPALVQVPKPPPHPLTNSQYKKPSSSLNLSSPLSCLRAPPSPSRPHASALPMQQPGRVAHRCCSCCWSSATHPQAQLRPPPPQSPQPPAPPPTAGLPPPPSPSRPPPRCCGDAHWRHPVPQGHLPERPSGWASDRRWCSCWHQGVLRFHTRWCVVGSRRAVVRRQRPCSLRPQSESPWRP